MLETKERGLRVVFGEHETPEDVSSPVRHALRKATGIHISTVAAASNRLKTVRRTEF